MSEATKRNELATFAGGCFWCTEAVFLRIKGVEKVVSGYSGGHMPDPTYQDVSTGSTGHAEAVQVTFDPDVVSYEKLLEVFFATHDPTTLNRQGYDVGTQYRSAIYYHDEAQKQTAQQLIQVIAASGKFADKIVTEVAPYHAFYEAEAYHQNFYDSNKTYPYCTVIIDPKLQKLYKDFKEFAF